jgi:GAF domain-containing protein
MNVRHARLTVLAIWAMIAAYALIQTAAWSVAGGIPRRPAVVVQVIGAWIVMLVLAAMTTRLIGSLSRSLTEQRDRHQVTVTEFEQLQIRNAILQVVARSMDVPLALQALAHGIARLVTCESVGLALVSEDGSEFQSYTARVRDEERRSRPRSELVFRTEGTAVGSVVRSREPLVINNSGDSAAAGFLDVNVLHSAGLRSAVIVPLVAKGRAVGTLNLVARQPNAFTEADVQVLLPIAELLAVAHVAQRLHVALGKYRMMEAMSELTLSVSAEINGALQTIIGQCNLLERSLPDTAGRRDVATIVGQAQRISSLLEKMRSAAHNRLQQVSDAVDLDGIPSSPEAYPEADTNRLE